MRRCEVTLCLAGIPSTVCPRVISSGSNPFRTSVVAGPLTSLTLPRDTSLNGLFGMSAPQSMGVLPETVEEGPEVELESNRQRTAEVVLYHYDVDCLPVAHPKTLFVLK